MLLLIIIVVVPIVVIFVIIIIVVVVVSVLSINHCRMSMTKKRHIIIQINKRSQKFKRKMENRFITISTKKK